MKLTFEAQMKLWATKLDEVRKANGPRISYKMELKWVKI